MTDTLLNEYLNATECAAELGVCPRTLERWRRLSTSPPITRIGKKIMSRREAVRDWLLTREQAIEA